MPRFKVLWNYESSAGRFSEGDVTEVDAALADLINRDSPGVLSPVEEDTPVQEAPKEDPAERAARRGRVASPEAEDEGVMTTADFGAVKKAEDAKEPEPSAEPSAEEPEPAPKPKSRRRTTKKG